MRTAITACLSILRILLLSNFPPFLFSCCKMLGIPYPHIIRFLALSQVSQFTQRSLLLTAKI